MVHETLTDPGPEKDPLFKLRNSPLHGIEAHRSSWYRRLLSAGYKGYLHGSLGGAALFGIGGGILGLGVAFALAPWAGGPLLIAVPMLASSGILYGKETFGGIAATAAIIAEDSELSENRRTLLDRLEKTKSPGEAEEIAELLDKQTEEQQPKKWFHWKSAILGAVIVGIAAMIAVGIVANGGAFAPETIAKFIKIPQIVDLLAKPVLAIGISGIIGAVGGGLLTGIDRSYIRKWFDAQEGLHDDRDVRYKVQEHDARIDRLKTAKQYDNEYNVNEAREPEKAAPISSNRLVSLSERPDAKISGTALIEKILSGEKERISAL
jgi:hypothetical protein